MDKNDLTLTKFESAILAWIQSQFSDVALHSQLKGIQVTKREHTGVGCYTTLLPQLGANRTSQSYGSHGPLSGPDFECPSIINGGGSLLWFKDGLVDQFEIYSYGNYFPENHEEIKGFTLKQPPQHTQF